MAWAIRLIHKMRAVLLQVTSLMQRICVMTYRHAITIRTVLQMRRAILWTLAAYAAVRAFRREIVIVLAM